MVMHQSNKQFDFLDFPDALDYIASFVYVMVYKHQHAMYIHDVT